VNEADARVELDMTQKQRCVEPAHSSARQTPRYEREPPLSAEFVGIRTSSGSSQPAQEIDCLRIALLVESSSGGVGRHVIDLACALRRLRHNVSLLYSARRIDARFSNDLTQVVSLGIDTCEVDMRHNLHLADISAIYFVRRHFRTHGPFDILHCHSTKAGFIGRLAALGTGICTLYTPHGLVTNAPFRSPAYLALAGWLERRLAALGDAVLCASQEEKEHALEVGLPGAKLYVVPNGVDLCQAERYLADRAVMRARLSLNDADICVGFVGRMIPGKAPGTLLEAFALARRGLAFPAKLVFVGSGPEGHSLQNRIEELRLQDEVFLAGELNGLQAMAAFDISTDVGGVSELVHEGCNGFVTKKSAPREMATALRKLLVDVGLRSKMGEASKRICGQFSLARMADRVMQLYQELLS